jgi:hypothetical protein
VYLWLIVHTQANSVAKAAKAEPAFGTPKQETANQKGKKPKRAGKRPQGQQAQPKKRKIHPKKSK